MRQEDLFMGERSQGGGSFFVLCLQDAQFLEPDGSEQDDDYEDRDSDG